MATISSSKDRQNGKEYSIQEIREIKERSTIEFERIKSNLVCYECGKPQMIPRLGEITEDHFAKAPKQSHHFDCYYFGDEYTQKEVDKIVKDIERRRPSQNEVMRAFDQIQQYLDRGESNLRIINAESSEHVKKYNKTKNTQKDEYDKKIESKYIPRKKLTKKISDEDVGVWKIYYGRVGIKHVKSNDDYQNYTVYAQLNGKSMPYRISIGINKNALEEVDQKTKQILGQILKNKRMVSLMILGKISQYKNYNNISVYNGNMLKISP